MEVQFGFRQIAQPGTHILQFRGTWHRYSVAAKGQGTRPNEPPGNPPEPRFG